MCRKNCFRVCTITLVGWWAINSAQAYFVSPALSLNDLEKEAPLICKVEAVSTALVDDPWFEKVQGFHSAATEFKIISVYKGDKDLKQFSFRHYTPSEKGNPGYTPQQYHFDSGRTYILFAKPSSTDGIFRQLWKGHRTLEDQGMLLASGKEPLAKQPLKDIFWRELTGLLKSEAVSDVIYAMSHLDTLSNGDYRNLQDFERQPVLEMVLPFITHPDSKVAHQAIWVLGCRNPYMAEDFAPRWLATIGDGDITGWARWDTKTNLGGQRYWKELAAVADSKAAVVNRALAIRALGLAQKPEILPLVERWIQDSEPLICQAATVLLADFPDRADRTTLRALATDPRIPVRIGAAHAIGFGQMKDLLPVVENMLDDSDEKVNAAAAMSLLSFSLEHNRKILQSHIERARFRPLFVNALAKEDPAAYLESLCELIREQPESTMSLARIPWTCSWDILFNYVQVQPAAKLKDGTFDKVLAALEFPASAGPDGPHFWSSAEPRDLYALYLQRGLSDRALAFRVMCVHGSSYDIDYFFKEVDKHPSLYTRSQ